MSNCLNCGKELVHTEGRRPKIYCDSKCKGKHWAKNATKERKMVKFEDFKAVLEENKALRAKLSHAPVNSYFGRKEDSAKLPSHDFSEKHKKQLANEPPRLKGETSIEYRLRMMEENKNSNPS